MDRIPLPVLSIILSIVGSWNHILALRAACKRWKKAIENAEHYMTFQGSGDPNLIPVNVKISSYLNHFATGWKFASLDLKNTEISESVLAEFIIQQPWLVKLDISRTEINFYGLLQSISKINKSVLASFNLKEIRLPDHEIMWTQKHFIGLAANFPNLVKFYAGKLQISYENFQFILENIKKLEILFCSIEEEDIEKFYTTTENQWSYLLQKSSLKVWFLESINISLNIPNITIITDDILSILKSLNSKDDLIKLETWLNLGGNVNFYNKNENSNPINIFFPWEKDEDLMVEAYKLMIMHGLDLSKHNIHDSISTYLNAAIQRNYKELGKLFINCGVDSWQKNKKNSEELPAMTFAIAKSDPTWIKLLLDNKIPINYGPDYCSPLCLAAFHNNIETFKFIYDNFQKDFNCPKHENFWYHNRKFLEFVLSEKSHICWPNIAIYQNAQNLISNHDVEAVPFIEILSKIGAASYEQKILYEMRNQLGNERSKPLMHIATLKKNNDKLKMLVRLKFDINICDDYGRTCVCAAAMYGFFDMVDVLCRLHANVNICDKDRNTPLHYAIKNGYEQTAKILVKYGANLMWKNNDGKTALMMANDQDENDYGYIYEASKNTNCLKCVAF